MGGSTNQVNGSFQSHYSNKQYPNKINYSHDKGTDGAQSTLMYTTKTEMQEIECHMQIPQCTRVHAPSEHKKAIGTALGKGS